MDPVQVSVDSALKLSITGKSTGPSPFTTNVHIAIYLTDSRFLFRRSILEFDLSYTLEEHFSSITTIFAGTSESDADFATTVSFSTFVTTLIESENHVLTSTVTVSCSPYVYTPSKTSTGLSTGEDTTNGHSLRISSSQLTSQVVITESHSSLERSTNIERLSQTSTVAFVSVSSNLMDDSSTHTSIQTSTLISWKTETTLNSGPYYQDSTSTTLTTPIITALNAGASRTSLSTFLFGILYILF